MRDVGGIRQSSRRAGWWQSSLPVGQASVTALERIVPFPLQLGSFHGVRLYRVNYGYSCFWCMDSSDEETVQ